MKNKYGIDDGDIACKGYFTPTMEAQMPKDRIIEVNIEDNWVTSINTFHISKDMIDKYLHYSIFGEMVYVS